MTSLMSGGARSGLQQKSPSLRGSGQHEPRRGPGCSASPDPGNTRNESKKGQQAAAAVRDYRRRCFTIALMRRTKLFFFAVGQARPDDQGNHQERVTRQGSNKEDGVPRHSKHRRHVVTRKPPGTHHTEHTERCLRSSNFGQRPPNMSSGLVASSGEM
ncbi:hypothetical protein VTG60DRAFT_543 [Thermothelomyces hinnuleus]